jgi:hypothetical protein
MNRKVIVRWAVGVSLVLGCVAVRVSWSDDFDNDAISRGSRPVISKTVVKRASADSNAPSLRQRIVELTAKRAERMSDEELTKAIDELTQTLADQDAAADAELQKAIDHLKSVVAQFPGTPAAERSTRALQAIGKPANDLAPQKGRAPRLDFGSDDAS